MKHRSYSPFGLRLSTTALIILLLILIGAVCAETVQEVPVTNTTIQPTVSETTNFSSPTTTIVPITLPPRVFLTKTETDQYTSTVYGIALPGTINETITTVQWDWGDNSTPEYHEFPFSHAYSSPGSYTLSVTAVQSDGQTATQTETISIVRQILPNITIGIIPTQVSVQPAGPGASA